MKLGDVLKRERKRREMSRLEMARLLGVSENDYRRIESGARVRLVDEAKVESWAAKLQLSVQELDDYP